MPELAFAIDGVEVVPYAATPHVAFKLRVSCLQADQPIHSIALRCQVQVEAARRRYAPREQERLAELFGTPDRWDRTLRTMLWTHTQTVVPRFVGSTVVDLPVPCTFDFNVAATKYFDGLDGGEVPLNFQFSGTVFYPAAHGALQVMQIAWDKDVRHRLPVSVWTGMMDHYYPDSAWLRLRRDVLRKLAAYKQQQGCATWDETLDALLAGAPIGVRR
jgi:Family of unknown function (DUF6084)